MNRRQFLSRSARALSAIAVPTIVPASVLRSQAPEQPPNAGFIGTGRQAFGSNLQQMMAVPGLQAVADCDVDRRMTGAGFRQRFTSSATTSPRTTAAP